MRFWVRICILGCIVIGCGELLNSQKRINQKPFLPIKLSMKGKVTMQHPGEPFTGRIAIVARNSSLADLEKIRLVVSLIPVRTHINTNRQQLTRIQINSLPAGKKIKVKLPRGTRIPRRIALGRFNLSIQAFPETRQTILLPPKKKRSYKTDPSKALSKMTKGLTFVVGAEVTEVSFNDCCWDEEIFCNYLPATQGDIKFFWGSHEISSRSWNRHLLGARFPHILGEQMPFYLKVGPIVISNQLPFIQIGALTRIEPQSVRQRQTGGRKTLTIEGWDLGPDKDGCQVLIGNVNAPILSWTEDQRYPCNGKIIVRIPRLPKGKYYIKLMKADREVAHFGQRSQGRLLVK